MKNRFERCNYFDKTNQGLVNSSHPQSSGGQYTQKQIDKVNSFNELRFKTKEYIFSRTVWKIFSTYSHELFKLGNYSSCVVCWHEDLEREIFSGNPIRIEKGDMPLFKELKQRLTDQLDSCPEKSLMLKRFTGKVERCYW